MAATVSFQWRPDPQVYANKFLTVAEGLDHTRAIPLAAAGGEMADSIRERFDTKTDPEGHDWAPWAESYINSSALPEVDNIDGILVRTSALREAASNTSAMVVTNDTLFYQTEFLPSYGLAHESGLDDRQTSLPQRSFLGMDDESQLRVYGYFMEWFDRTIDLYVTTTGKIAPRHAIRGASGMFATRSSVGRGALPRF
jgi:hypothetical protein